MTHLFALITLLLVQGILLRSFPEAFSHTDVQLTLNFGFLLLAAYLMGEWTYRIHLPKLTGYLFAGILLGPDLMGAFSHRSVGSLRFIDDLALTFIALSAGIELRVQDLRKHWRILTGLSIGIPIVVFALVFLLTFFAGPLLGLFPPLSTLKKAVLASLLGTLAIARSPSSTLAVIKECKARGRFSETALGVTVATDILVIVLFSLFFSIAETVFHREGPSTIHPLIAIPVEILLSIVSGLGLAGLMKLYIRTIRTDRIFFLLCVVFLVTRLSEALAHLLESLTGIALRLEPLLICMSAGFFLENLFHRGSFYEESIDQASLPIFVIFFALAGTALDLRALSSMWPVAILYAAIRFFGMIFASQGVMRILGDSYRQGTLYGMSFITQAGVSIGLASLIPKRFPQEGEPLFSLWLAVIIINQILGPVTFKIALERSGEARFIRQKSPFP